MDMWVLDEMWILIDFVALQRVYYDAFYEQPQLSVFSLLNLQSGIIINRWCEEDAVPPAPRPFLTTHNRIESAPSARNALTSQIRTASRCHCENRQEQLQVKLPLLKFFQLLQNFLIGKCAVVIMSLFASLIIPPLPFWSPSTRDGCLCVSVVPIES